jgi:hypothetical protein
VHEDRWSVVAPLLLRADLCVPKPILARGTESFAFK